jgi:hypothetical protein
MLACGEPIEQFCPNCAAFCASISRINGPGSSSNHQHSAHLHSARLSHAAHQPSVSGVEPMIVQIERHFRLNPSRLYTPILMRVKIAQSRR